MIQSLQEKFPPHILVFRERNGQKIANFSKKAGESKKLRKGWLRRIGSKCWKLVDNFHLRRQVKHYFLLIKVAFLVAYQFQYEAAAARRRVELWRLYLKA